MTDMTALPNSVIESQIRLFTDDLHLRDIAMADIDVARSRHAQNRREEKLDEDHAFRIAEALDAGVEVPPLIVNEVDGKFWIVDGNHRQAAYELLGKLRVPAYVVKVDADTYTQMCLIGNAFNGKPLTDADRVRHAMAAMKLGLPGSTVAKMWGIHPDRLTALRRASEGREKVAMAGIKSANQLSGVAAEIANRMEVEHLRQLGDAVTKATAKELEEAARAINAAPSSQRDREALRQSIVLEQSRQARLAPKARQKGAMTSAQARTRLKEVLLAIKTNRSMLNDQALRALISELSEVSDGSARSAA